jgi:AraC-like DNA-binding protein
MLKPAFEALQSTGPCSFLVRTFEREAFRAPYHFHPEYELTFISKGEGKRYVGTHMAAFGTGDLVLLGSNLPHCWKTDAGGEATENPGAIVIQFNPDFLGADFLSKPELTNIHQLLQRSRSGMQFTGKTRRWSETHILSLAAEENNFEKMMLLLRLLQKLALSGEYRLLAPGRVAAALTREDQQRINEVLAYVVDNFRQKISLGAAAEVAKMSANAFCKYFKKITRKTFMETVIEYRLHYAAQQLVQTDQPVSFICFDSGFGDVSHFNKTFKAKMRVSPLHYRKKFVSETADDHRKW